MTTPAIQQVPLDRVTQTIYARIHAAMKPLRDQLSKVQKTGELLAGAFGKFQEGLPVLDLAGYNAMREQLARVSEALGHATEVPFSAATRTLAAQLIDHDLPRLAAIAVKLNEEEAPKFFAAINYTDSEFETFAVDVKQKITIRKAEFDAAVDKIVNRRLVDFRRMVKEDTAKWVVAQGIGEDVVSLGAGPQNTDQSLKGDTEPPPLATDKLPDMSAKTRCNVDQSTDWKRAARMWNKAREEGRLDHNEGKRILRLCSLPKGLPYFPRPFDDQPLTPHERDCKEILPRAILIAGHPGLGCSEYEYRRLSVNNMILPGPPDSWPLARVLISAAGDTETRIQLRWKFEMGARGETFDGDLALTFATKDEARLVMCEWPALVFCYPLRGKHTDDTKTHVVFENGETVLQNSETEGHLLVRPLLPLTAPTEQSAAPSAVSPEPPVEKSEFPIIVGKRLSVLGPDWKLYEYNDGKRRVKFETDRQQVADIIHAMWLLKAFGRDNPKPELEIMIKAGHKGSRIAPAFSSHQGDAEAHLTFRKRVIGNVRGKGYFLLVD